jgi:hypothetical protein
MTRERIPSDELELAPLPEDEAEELARALSAAWSPTALDPAVNEALIAAALEDPLAAPTEEEVAESERLRAALDGQGQHPALDLVHALRAAGAPRPVSSATSNRLVRSALGDEEPSKRSNVVFVAFGAAGTALAALAASWFLLVRPALDGGAAATIAEHADLAVSRSTAAMFTTKFDTATTTERVDRIARARSRELRSNRYALWGVR